MALVGKVFMEFVDVEMQLITIGADVRDSFRMFGMGPRCGYCKYHTCNHPLLKDMDPKKRYDRCMYEPHSIPRAPQEHTCGRYELANRFNHEKVDQITAEAKIKWLLSLVEDLLKNKHKKRK